MNVLNYLLIAVGLRTKYTLRVKQGIKLLNENVSDWRDYVRTPLTASTMPRLGECVLGQIATSTGIDVFRLLKSMGFKDWNDAAVAGFALKREDADLWSDEWAVQYGVLAKEWNKQLRLK